MSWLGPQQKSHRSNFSCAEGIKLSKAKATPRYSAKINSRLDFAALRAYAKKYNYGDNLVLLKGRVKPRAPIKRSS